MSDATEPHGVVRERCIAEQLPKIVLFVDFVTAGASRAIRQRQARAGRLLSNLVLFKIEQEEDAATGQVTQTVRIRPSGAQLR
jgi:hypothetical protein